MGSNIEPIAWRSACEYVGAGAASSRYTALVVPTYRTVAVTCT